MGENENYNNEEQQNKSNLNNAELLRNLNSQRKYKNDKQNQDNEKPKEKSNQQVNEKEESTSPVQNTSDGQDNSRENIGNSSPNSNFEDISSYENLAKQNRIKQINEANRTVKNASVSSEMGANTTAAAGGVTAAEGAAAGSGVVATRGATAAGGGVAATGKAAITNPLFWIGVGVAIFILFVAVIFRLLSPTTILKANVAFIESIWKSAETLVTGFFGDIIDSSDGGYDEIFLDHKKLMDEAFKSAYAQAIEDAKTYCGDSWEKSKETLAYTNSSSWEDVYSDINYGDLIACYNICYYSMDVDISNVDLQDFKNKILSKDNINNLYSIRYDLVKKTVTATEENAMYDNDNDIPLTREEEKLYQEALMNYRMRVLVMHDLKAKKPLRAQFNKDGYTEEYYYITICPYNLTSLYSMTGKDINGEYSGEIDGLTNYDMHLLMIEQMKLMADESYDVMGFDNVTPLTAEASGANTSTILADTSGLIVVGDNPATVWKYLKAAGFSDEGAAGMMGNIFAENGFSTAMSGDQGSVGICQWLGGRKDNLIAYAKAKGLDVTSIEAQAGFLVESDFPSRMADRGGEAQIKDATDIILATDLVCAYFESPANYASKDAYDKGRYAGVIAWNRFLYSEHLGRYYLDLEKRRNAAINYYNEYTGK